MTDPERYCVAEERSGHCAALDDSCLYVWGGYVTIEENEVYLPNDEIWIYEFDSGLWTMHITDGDMPPSMSGSCGACLNSNLYIFGGYDDKGYSNKLYFMNLQLKSGHYTWKHIKTFKGQPPTARDKLSCWIYKDRLIYFGGYGSRKHNELNDCFDVHDASWKNAPQARAAHSCAVLGNKGYVFGGRVLHTRMNDLHFINLDTWTWSGGITVNGGKPQGRSWHTLTPVSDDQLFLFGGLSADSVPLSDEWIYSVKTNEWKQFKHLAKDRPRLWHTACLGKESEVLVFGGSKDDLLSLDTGHCNDLLIFQIQPYSLLRLCLDSIGKNASVLENQISLLPKKLLQQAMKRITFWAATKYRQNKKHHYYDEENNTGI